MADVIQIVVDVDDKDILRTIQNHERLEKRVEQLNKEYKNLDKLFNTNKISAQNYAKAVAQVDAEINKLSTVMRKGGKEMEALATGMNISGKASRRMEVGFQQAGYQLQDFIVQVQGGTNPLIAFSQQGSQLAGFFAGPWGAMIGLGIAAVSSLAMAFLATSEDAEQLQKNLDKVKDNLGDFQDRVKKAEETVSSFAYAMAQVQKTQIEAAWAALGESTAGSFEASFMAKLGSFLGANLWTGFATWGEVSGKLAGDNFAAAFGDGAKGILTTGLLDQIGQAVKDKNIDILDSTIQQLSAFSGMTEQGAQFLEYLIRMRDEAYGFTDEVKTLAQKIEEASSSAEKLSKLDLSIPIGKAAKVAELLANNMGIALEAAVSLINAATQQTSGPILGGRGLVQPNASDRFMMSLGGEYTPYKSKKSRSGGKSPAKQLEEYMAQQEKAVQIDRTRLMLGKEDARIQELLNKYKEAGVAVDMKRIEQLAKEEERLRLLTSAHTYLENALMSVVDGTQSVGNAFKAMIRDMILDLYREKVAKNFASTVLGFFGFANGGVFSGGNVTAFANGGVVGSPTYFPMAGGKAGLMGEAGPEAIMPLKRGANGKLGVEMHGGGSVVVNQTINVSTGVQQTVRAEIKSLMPQIAEQSKAAVLDAKRRGGSYGGKF